VPGPDTSHRSRPALGRAPGTGRTPADTRGSAPRGSRRASGPSRTRSGLPSKPNGLTLAMSSAEVRRCRTESQGLPPLCSHLSRPTARGLLRNGSSSHLSATPHVPRALQLHCAPDGNDVDATVKTRRILAAIYNNLPILVTGADAGPLRFAGAAARPALTSDGPRGIGAKAHGPRGTLDQVPVARSHDARRPRRARGPSAYVRAAVLQPLGAQLPTPRLCPASPGSPVTSRALDLLARRTASRRPSVHLRLVDPGTA